MLELCGIFDITANDPLSGEVVTMDNYNKQMENTLLEMVREKEEADKRLLKLEIVLGIIAILPLIAASVIAITIPMEE